MLSADWLPSSAVRSNPMGVHFLFDAGIVPAARLEAEVVPQASELEDWALISESEIDLLGPWGAARARRALAVLRGESEVDLVSYGR